MTPQLLNYRIVSAQAAGKNLLAELLLEQERLIVGRRFGSAECGNRSGECQSKPRLEE